MFRLDAETLQLLNDAASKFIGDEYTFEHRCAVVNSKLGYSEESWKRMADFGWFSIPFSEAYGGLGGSVDDLLGIAERLGYNNAVAPLVTSVVIAGSLLNTSSNEKIKSELIPRISEGALFAVAYEELQSRGNPANVATLAERKGDEFVITGEKVGVLTAPESEYLLVSARTSGGLCDRDGISLFVIPSKADGVTMVSYPMVDGTSAANISLNRVHIHTTDLISEFDAGYLQLEKSLQNGLLTICAEAVGLMTALFEKTVEYCKTRKQFGVSIASFQVLQHRIADMYIALERSKSTLEYIKGMDESSSARDHLTSALKVQTGKSGKFIGQQSIQLHGGIGMTDELDIGHYFKRLSAIEAILGNSEYHLRKMARFG